MTAPFLVEVFIEKFADPFLVISWVNPETFGVAGIVDDPDLLGCVSGTVVFDRHVARHEFIVSAMDDEDRQFVFRQLFNR